MATRVQAALGTLAFLIVAPGVVAGLVPWLITGWQPLPPADGPGALRWTGLILIASGLVVVLEAFARLAVAAMIFGQAVLFASSALVLYGVLVVAAFDTFVRLYEEPTLRDAYGERYAAYCAATPRWIPRLRR